MLFDENDPGSGVIESFIRTFARNPVIENARLKNIENIRKKQNWFQRRKPLEKGALTDSKVFSFEYGNYVYVIDVKEQNFENDHLHITQIAKYHGMSYYKLELDIDNQKEGIKNGPSEIRYSIYVTREDYESNRPTFSAVNTASCIQVALRILSKLKRPEINYSFYYN